MIIEPATRAETAQIEAQLDDFNQQVRPFSQPRPETFSYSAHDAAGALMGGIDAYASAYRIGYIETLWVAPAYRRRGVATALLAQVEAAMVAFGCGVVHLETFDYQAPAFYQARGYTEFGRLTYPNAQVTEVFMMKALR
ncbi:GNAT family N-acetyltransferase [Lacticaseibacillus daqingensis]|uniref:GNAT family N-acetyltransferase n=1 Tax=Lacticaseibacillus daqingensis TaxID=2486014 RepID=UPI0013DDFE46|nr:GNAT family N-acetyltransferase [Lacticaseibacillus daqingensis]